MNNNEHFFKTLFEALPGLYLIIDTKFTIVAVTDSYLAATKTKRENILGKNIFEVFPDNPEEHNATGVTTLSASLNRVLTLRKADTLSIQKYDIRRPESEGAGFEERYWSPVNSPMFDNDGNVIYIIHKVEDVTEFLKLKQQGEANTLLTQELQIFKDKMDQEIVLRTIERRKAVEDLKLAKLTAEKLAEEAMVANRTKSAFLAAMSHEIRTPLNGIIGMTDLLLLTPQSTEQREYLETVRFSSDSLLKVINDILDFSKLESGHVELDLVDFNLRDLIENTIESVALSAHIKGIAIGGVIADDVPEMVIGDAMRIGQILRNLLANAIKFTNEGQISLTVSLIASPQNTQDLTAVNLCFKVTDTGIGISEEVKQKLFQPFVQGDASTTRKYGGTGLGLVICKRLLNLMAGTINLHSREGSGSEFTFTLTLHKGNQLKSAIIDETSIQLQNMRVLVVDDNEINRTVLNLQLRSWKMHCDQAENAFEAIAKMRSAAANGEPYQLAIIDCMMPVMDGFELSKKIISIPELATTKLIMLTSIGVPATSSELKKIGIGICLSKPIRQSKLFETVIAALKMPGNKHLNNSRTINPNPTNIEKPPTRNLLGKQILIADDNPTKQQVAMRMLKYLGYNTGFVSNGIEAVTAFQQHDLGLILMDCQMPEMDGYTATKQIREIELLKNQAPIPIIAMTAHAMEGDREKCLDAGMSDYISKPISINELKDKLNQWILVRNTPETNSKDMQSEVAVLNLERLNIIFKDDKPALKNFMNEFISITDRTLLDIKKAISNQDSKEAAKLVHRLLGSCGGAGAEQIYTSSKQLEQLIQQQQWDDALGFMESINKNFAQLKSYALKLVE
jgi:signal transduction histidine kinase/DNA-binding response OmpR family regulator